MKFDEILEHIGELGFYQKRLYLFVCIPAFFTAAQSMITVVIADIPKHRCALWDNDTYNDNDMQHQIWVNSSIPYIKDGGHMVLSKCLVYANISNTGGNVSAVGNDTASCNRWVYDKTDFIDNVATAFNTVCDDKYLHTHTLTAQFAGTLIGALVMGFLSDIIGRKLVLFINIGILVVSGVVTSFAPNIYVFMVCRLFNAFASIALFVAAFVIVIELVGPSKRVLAGVVIQLFWSLGMFVAGAAAYGVREWDKLMLILGVPSAVMLLLWWFIPESPRWLLSRGKIAQSEAILKKAADVNGTTLPEGAFENIEMEKHPGNFKQLFTNSVVRNRTLILYFNWFVVVMVYYGLGLSLAYLHGNIYTNYFLGTTAETLAYIVCIFLMDRVGRKILYCCFILLCGLSCVAVLFPVIYGGPTWVATLLTLIGRFGATGSFGVIYVFSAEIFPTIVRNSGIGSSSTIGRLGSAVASPIADLGMLIGGDLKFALPQVVFGVFSVAAGCLALFLPETLHRTLPETLEDARNFGKSSKYEVKPTENGIQPNVVNMDTHM